MVRPFASILSILFVLMIASSASAGEADVLQVKANQSGSLWSFAVTVQHADEGWDHYADRWEVLTTEGEVLGTRVLAHPHVGEQPFTRSLGGVDIPAGLKGVVVRARDSVHGYGGAKVSVKLTAESQ